MVAKAVEGLGEEIENSPAEEIEKPTVFVGSILPRSESEIFFVICAIWMSVVLSPGALFAKIMYDDGIVSGFLERFGADVFGGSDEIFEEIIAVLVESVVIVVFRFKSVNLIFKSTINSVLIVSKEISRMIFIEIENFFADIILAPFFKIDE